MSIHKTPRAALLALAVAGGLLGCDARQAAPEAAAAAPAAQAAYVRSPSSMSWAPPRSTSGRSGWWPST